VNSSCTSDVSAGQDAGVLMPMACPGPP